MRSTYLYDLIRKRKVTFAESWLAQGVPHPDIKEAARFKSRCPFASYISMETPMEDRCPLQDQQVFLGNMMHWSQIGLWFLYNLATTGPSCLVDEENVAD